MMDRETRLAYQQLLEARIPPNIELLKELLTGRKSLHVRRKLIGKHNGKSKALQIVSLSFPALIPSRAILT